MAHLLLLHAAEGTGTLQHFVEVHLMTVKLGTVHANEACLSAHGDAACAAHARTVHHDGVQGHVSGYLVLLGQQTAELHHYGRTDGKALVHLLALDYFLHAHGDHALLAIGTVVGHDDDLVGSGTHLVLQDDKFLAAAGDNAYHTVAGSLQRLYDGEHGSGTHTATGAEHGAEVLNVCGLAQRTYDVGHLVAHVQVAQACGRKSHLLHHQSDGTLLRICSGNGQGHAFALLAHADDNEVSGLAGLGYERCFHFQAEYLFAVLYFADYLVHLFVG